MALATWALVTRCPMGEWVHTMATIAAEFGPEELVRWLIEHLAGRREGEEGAAIPRPVQPRVAARGVGAGVRGGKKKASMLQNC